MTINIDKEELNKMLIDAFNEGYRLGREHPIKEEPIETIVGNELIYHVNGKDYKQMTIGDLYD